MLIINKLITAGLILMLGLTTVYAIDTPVLQPSQSRFIQFMLPKIDRVNQTLEQDHSKLVELNTLQQTGIKLHSSQIVWLKQIAKQYKVKDVDLSNQQAWDLLLKRVDIVPPSLVLAQAINESAWGRSRFAKQANNFFGLHCYHKNCGLVPRRLSQNSHYEVTKFSSVLMAVKSYVRNLNTNPAYQHFRQQRYLLRQSKQTITGLAVVAGLKHYSEKKEQYVGIIKKIISQYHLERYDLS